MIVGLDVSTSCTGIALLDDDGSIVDVRAVTTSHLENLADKADAVLCAVYDAVGCATVTSAFIEESLQAFRPGLSSANTICSLSKMNGLVAYLVKRAFNVEVVSIPSQTARKLCGIRLQRGTPAKPQVMQWALATHLLGWSVPYKRRSAEPVEQVKDAIDGLVVALAGNMILADRDALPADRATGVHNFRSDRVPAETVRKDRCVRIRKGSVRPVSIRVMPVEIGSEEAKVGDTCS